MFMIVGMSISYHFITQDLPSLTERTMAKLSIDTLPLFFGTVIYVFEGIGIILPLQNEMKEPKNFSRPLGVLNVGVLVLSLLVIWYGMVDFMKIKRQSLVIFYLKFWFYGLLEIWRRRCIKSDTKFSF